MKINKLADIKDLEGKRVLTRVDFNVPIENGKITDTARIEGAIPTIQYLEENGAKIILISHLGRPKGKVSEEFRLTEVARELEKLIGKKITKLEKVLGREVEKAIEEMENGEIVMLENIRFDEREEQCEEKFTKQLAELGDIFVNDAFGTAHRRHASTAGLAEHLPAYAGLLMQKEIEALSPLLNDEPRHPLTMIFGGAKIDTKIGIIKNFISKADYFLMGGGIANTFLHAAGYNVAQSLFEDDKTETAREIMLQCEKDHEKFVLPHDVVVASDISDEAETLETPIEDVSGDMKILDIGKWSIEKFNNIIAKSGTVIWNGPVGLSEMKPFENGTKMIAQAIADSECVSIVGGGDTAEAISRLGIDETKFTHISTGGGACIEFLSGDKLPGIECLKHN